MSSAQVQQSGQVAVVAPRVRLRENGEFVRLVDEFVRLVDCVETGRPPITRPEHALHALEIMLAAQAAGADGAARRIESDFPAPVYG